MALLGEGGGLDESRKPNAVIIVNYKRNRMNTKKKIIITIIK